MTAEWASSISSLHPCMELRPYRSPAPVFDSLYFSVLGFSRKAPIFDRVQTDVFYHQITNGHK